MPAIRLFAITLVASLFWVPAARAQDAAKDKVLDGLLKKLEQSDQDKATDKDTAEAEGKPAPDAKADQSKDSAADTKDAKGRKKAEPGDLAPPDKAIDSILEKLGETEETPAPQGRRPLPGAGPNEPPTPPKPDQKEPADQLKGKNKDLDEHLEELLGRKRKKKNSPDDDEGSGPLSQIIKEMRDVEQRLGKPDTGEDTRKKQEEIVKNIDKIIEEIKNSAAQGQGRIVRIREVRQAGQKKGGSQGQQGAQGKNAKGAPPMKPAKPPTQSVVAVDKNEWGHLPPELREVMNNVFKEEPLPERVDLIKRYYLSVSKKGQSREE